jgi:thymidylate kinase
VDTRRSGLAVDVVDTIDEAAREPVLVIGDGPRAAPVLRVLVRATEVRDVSAHLEAVGLLRRGATWATFERGEAQAVVVLTPESWGLRPGPGRSYQDLFTGCVPLPGFDHLVLPAPSVVLVLMAHELARARGELSDDQRKRALSAAGSDPGVWDDAATLAARFQLTAALRLLRRALGRPERRTSRRRRQSLVREFGRYRRRPVLVSLSGPDGSGKSTQVSRLVTTLDALGVPTGSAWVPTTKRPTLPTSIRTWAAGWRRPAESDSTGGGTSAGDGATRPSRRRTAPLHVRLVEHLWITSAALSNAAKIWASVWRGRGNEVLVMDRFVLDADVKLTYWYSLHRGADIRMERRLFRAIAPKVDVSVLLTVAPETNYARRADEWRLEAFRHFHRIYAEAARELGAVVVDADRPVVDVARDVAETVWRGLP